MNLEDATRQINQLNHFDYSLRLFESNYGELIEILSLMYDESTGLELFAVVNNWKLEEFLTRVSFKLHNYVCAAKSLIDHSRVLYSRVYGTDESKFQDYLEEVKARFENNELTKFIEFLRTYCQHEMLPNISSSMSFDSFSEDGFIFKVNLDGAELLKSSCIRSQAKQFMKSQPNNIDLKEVIEAYHNQVVSFHSWVKERQLEIHSEEIKVLNEAHQKQMLDAIKNFIDSFDSLQGTSSVKECFYTMLSKESYKVLESYSNDETIWLNQALEIVESYAALPEGIKLKLADKCKPIIKSA